MPRFRPLIRHSGRACLRMLCALPLMCAAPPDAVAGPQLTRAQVTEHRADLKELRSRIDQLKKEIAGDEASRAEAADQLQASERAISRLQQELRRLSRDRDELLATRDRLRGETEQLAGTLDDQQAGLAAALGAYHRSSLRATNDRGAAHVLQRRLLAAAASARTGQIALTADSLERKAGHAQATQRQADALAKVEARQREQEAALVAQRVVRQQLIHRISARLDVQRRQIGTLQQDERRLSRLVDRLSRILAARKQPRKAPRVEPAPASAHPTARPSGGPGKLPLTRPVATGPGKRAAKGIFFAVPEGHPVRAVAPGQVVFVDWLRGFGNLLIIDHGDEILSIYGYNDALLRQLGDQVARGDVVASAGDSGGRGETGLYFEMRHKGAAIDAMRWLAPR